MKYFVFPATVLVKGGCGNRNGRSISDGSEIWMGLGVLAVVVVGATSIGDWGCLWTSTIGNIVFPEVEVIVSQLLEVFTVDAVCKNYEFFSETDEAKGKFLLSVESWDQSRITSVSHKKILFLGSFISLQYTVSLEVFEPEVSIVK